MTLHKRHVLLLLAVRILLLLLLLLLAIRVVLLLLLPIGSRSRLLRRVWLVGLQGGDRGWWLHAAVAPAAHSHLPVRIPRRLV